MIEMQAIYQLRYTYDLLVAAQSSDLMELIGRVDRNFKMHIVTLSGELVWQSSPSVRYGDRCV